MLRSLLQGDSTSDTKEADAPPAAAAAEGGRTRVNEAELAGAESGRELLHRAKERAARRIQRAFRDAAYWRVGPYANAVAALREIVELPTPHRKRACFNRALNELLVRDMQEALQAAG